MTPPAVALVAPSGTGKTTFLEMVVAELARRGRRAGTIKHAAHGCRTGPEGADSRRLALAGASPAAVVAPGSLTLSIATPGAEMPPETVVERYMGGADIVLLEGFKGSALPKVEVHRAGAALLLLSPEGRALDGGLVAVVSDVALSSDVPVFPLDDPLPFCDFLERAFLPPGPAPTSG